MNIVIVTGMSGAGKSTALNILEDEGYYCVDNIPIALMTTFISLAKGQEKSYRNIAMSIDIRSGAAIDDIDEVLNEMSDKHFSYKILYLDASDEVLVKRYKETRRTHPLAKDDRVDKAIEIERSKLEFLRNRADYIVDTSQMLTREFKQEMEKIFVEKSEYSNLFVTVLSFGFKYGIPSDADLVFDVRFLPNPYYDDSLRYHTGNEKEVQDFVKQGGTADIFLGKLYDMIGFLLPYYVQEGKNQLVIAVGCTGGKHRSVTIANMLHEKLKTHRDIGLKIEHRDIGKDSITAQ